MRVGVLVLLVMVVGVGSCGEIGWEEHLIDTSTSFPSLLYIVDLSSDGNLDALIRDKEGIWLYDNILNGTSYRIIYSEDCISSISSGDLDGDGDLDVIFGGCNKIGWFQNNDGDFRYRLIVFNENGVRDVSAGDVDGDGDLDLLSVESESDEVTWYENNGEGGFSGHRLSISGNYPLFIENVDMDQDGDSDILVGDFLDKKMILYENDGEESFEVRTLFSVESFRDADVGDLDGDGDLDVLVGGDNFINWYENNGSGFVAHAIMSIELNYVFGTVHIFDIDLDGDLDVLFESGANKVFWSENDGEAGFENHEVGYINTLQDLFVGDIDLDGDLDIASLNSYLGKLVWFESNVSVKNDNCDGRLNVFLKDGDNNAMEGLILKIDEEEFLSDEFGEISIERECGAFDLEVYCGDGETFCGRRSGVISENRDVDSFVFDSDVCRSGRDVWVRESEVLFERISSGLAVEVLVRSVRVDEKVNVSLIRHCRGKNGLIGSREIWISGEEEVSFYDDYLGACESVEVLVSELSEEDNYLNNRVEVEVVWPLDVYLKVDSGNDFVDSAIEDYLDDYVNVVSRTESEVEIYVGKNLYDGDYLKSGLIRFDGKRDGLPWEGLIDFEDDEIYVFGNEVEGTLAAVKKLVGERARYLNLAFDESSFDDVYLGRDDLDSIKIYDFLRAGENEKVYGKESEVFGDLVERVLRGDFFEASVRRVVTDDGDVLRLKNLNAEFSSGLRNYLDAVGRPVVMAGGLFSSLETWEDGGVGLAFDLADAGKDVWEIEITGGALMECEDCRDYSYEDLVDSFWPALVGAVQFYSGAVVVDYVGHSNGCRVALSSLSEYQESGKVDVGSVEGVGIDLESDGEVVGTFVGVGCPASLNGGTFLSYLARQGTDGGNLGDVAMDNLKGGHVSMSDYTGAMYLAGDNGIADAGKYFVYLVSMFFGGDDEISWNLMKYYNDLAINGDSDFDLSGLEIDRLRLYYGRLFGTEHDGVVPVEDMTIIYNQIVSEDKYAEDIPGVPFDADHVFVKNKKKTKDNILEDLK